jgi:hypothetical protein
MPVGANLQRHTRFARRCGDFLAHAHSLGSTTISFSGLVSAIVHASCVENVSPVAPLPVSPLHSADFTVSAR